MEIYRIKRKDLKESVNIAKKVSSVTGISFLYHWIDCLYSIVMYGCSPEQYIFGKFYKLRSFDRNNTYTHSRTYVAKRFFCDPESQHLCSNKVDFNRFFSEYVKRSWIFCKEASANELLTFFIANKRVIVKPFNLSKGQGVYELDREEQNEELVKSLLGKNVLLEAFIEQHPDLCLGNKSVNTIRINTILDSKGTVHFIKAAIRCGVGDSVVDNFSAGGIVYPINIDYGCIEGPGISKSFDRSIYIHPGTTCLMVGKVIPFWPEVIRIVREAAMSLQKIRFVGWDVAITTDGPELVEANTRPGANLIESIGEKRGFWKLIKSLR